MMKSLSLPLRFGQPAVHYGRGFLLPLILLAAWWIVARFHLVSALLLPKPEAVVATFVTLFQNNLLWSSLECSLELVVYGFLLGAGGGLLFGTLMGMSRTLEKMGMPLFNVIRQVPLVAWIPLLILWCGIGQPAKIIFIAVGASYPVVLNTLAGIRGVPKDYLEVAHVFQYSRLKLWKRVLLPAALPSIFTGIRLSLSKSWTMVIGAEAFMANVSTGIGNLMVEGGEQFRMDVVIVCIIVIGVIGLAMNQALRLFERHFLRWKSGFNVENA